MHKVITEAKKSREQKLRLASGAIVHPYTDVVWAAVGNPAGRFPAFKVFNLPFTIHSAQRSSRALWEYVQANDLAREEFAGVRLLAVQVATLESNEKARVLSGAIIFALNFAAYKSLSDELKKVIIANSGAKRRRGSVRFLAPTARARRRQVNHRRQA